MDSFGLHHALTQETPLQIVGTINAYSALLAQKTGYRAIYLSGAGVANASFGLPDLGITNLTDVAEEVRKITSICNLPLLVDIDTGWGTLFNIERTIKTLIQAGAAGIHIEDQVSAKRCGHRPKKVLVSAAEMCDRLKACLDAKSHSNFVIMARTDALSIEGLDKTLERLKLYTETGAEMIFLEGATQLSQYQQVVDKFPIPVLANITEFGLTPLFTKEQLASVGIKLILYPLSAFRAMSKAAEEIYQTIRSNGTQASKISMMQTRKELYEVLDYLKYEQKIDELFGKGKE